MERELWARLMIAVRDVRRTRSDTAYHTHATATIVRVYLWAVLHDRPVLWACDRRHWDPRTRPVSLPSQSTMSRRLRQRSVQDFLQAMGRRLVGELTPTLWMLKLLDGKPLTVSAHSTDRDATWGRGAGQDARGYKLHLIDSGKPMPETFEVTPLHESEQVVARRLIPQLRPDHDQADGGYLLADAGYDDNTLYQLAAQVRHRFMAPRRKPYTGLGHQTFHPDRLRAIDTLEVAPLADGGFGRGLMSMRTSIERSLGNLASFFAGLHHLPPWVRRLHRVQQYVQAKLLINAARIRVIRA